MKRVVLFVFAVLFCGVAIAQTINWYVDGQVYQTTTCTSGNSVTPPTPPAKYGYTFKGWIPDYVPLEYIEASGTQYIDTGFKPNQNTRVIMEYMVVSNVQAEGWIFAVRNAVDRASFALLYDGGHYLRSDYNIGTRGGFLDNRFFNNKITVDKNKNEATLYDEQGQQIGKVQSSHSNFQTIYNLILLCGSTAGTVSCMQNGSIRVYSFKLYDNGVLVRDMIPVDTGVPCMYDRISNNLFFNAGTGNFIAGPVISE